MSEPAVQEREGQGWREIRHYAYVERPYEDVWPALAQAPERVLGGDGTSPARPGVSELHVQRAGIDAFRTVRLRFGGLVCDEDRARLALHWEDARHPKLFPVLEAVLELAPLAAGRRHVTQVGLVGRYRPPFGAVGGVADRLAGEQFAAESVARFVEGVARRLEDMVEAGPPDPEEEPADPGPVDTDPALLRRVLLPLERLEDRPGGAAGVRRYLAGKPGVVRAQVDAVAGIAEIVYDPELCHPGRILADLEDDPLPSDDPGPREPSG